MSIAGLTPQESQHRIDRLGTDGPEIQWRFRSHRGQFIADRTYYGDPAVSTQPYPRWQRGRWGFTAAQTYAWTPSRTQRIVFWSIRSYAIPCWAAVIVLALLPALATRSVLQTRRQKRWQSTGHCPHCGYDLRGSPGRCPECGKVPAALA